MSCFTRTLLSFHQHRGEVERPLHLYRRRFIKTKPNIENLNSFFQKKIITKFRYEEAIFKNVKLKCKKMRSFKNIKRDFK